MSKIFGKVAWFHDGKGYGFIHPDDDTQDIFVHFSDVLMEGHKCLIAEQRVSFEIGAIEKDGQSKPKAINVEVINESAKTV